jgi:DnaJ family protein C protein 25
MWRNMYRYYRRRMAPKVDVRLVIAITLTIISAVQVGIHQDQDKILILL